MITFPIRSFTVSYISMTDSLNHSHSILFYLQNIKFRSRFSSSSLKEDNLVLTLMKELGPHKPNWSRVASQLNEAFGSTRTGKQCRERWLNGLRPDIKKGSWTEEEVIMIRYFHTTFGPK